jgi:hypothetical protein
MEFEKNKGCIGFGAVMAIGLTAAIAAVEKEVIRFVAATTVGEEDLDDDDDDEFLLLACCC